MSRTISEPTQIFDSSHIQPNPSRIGSDKFESTHQHAVPLPSTSMVVKSNCHIQFDYLNCLYFTADCMKDNTSIDTTVAVQCRSSSSCHIADFIVDHQEVIPQITYSLYSVIGLTV